MHMKFAFLFRIKPCPRYKTTKFIRKDLFGTLQNTEEIPFLTYFFSSKIPIKPAVSFPESVYFIFTQCICLLLSHPSNNRVIQFSHLRPLLLILDQPPYQFLLMRSRTISGVYYYKWIRYRFTWIYFPDYRPYSSCFTIILRQVA